MDKVEAIRKCIEALRPLDEVFGDEILLSAVGKLLQEPAEGAATRAKVGRIVETLSEWEY